MKKELCLLLCFVLILSMVGCGSSSSVDNTNDETISNSQAQETAPEKTTFAEDDSDSEAQETAPEKAIFAEDDVVNDFIIQYNEISENDFTDIRKGNIRTKYYAYSYGYYCELLNSNSTNKISISINQTNENAAAGIAGMRDIFHDIIKTIDSSLNDDEIYACFDQLIETSLLKDNIQLGNALILFAPDKELSNGYSRGHIEIDAQ